MFALPMVIVSFFGVVGVLCWKDDDGDNAVVVSNVGDDDSGGSSDLDFGIEGGDDSTGGAVVVAVVCCGWRDGDDGDDVDDVGAVDRVTVLAMSSLFVGTDFVLCGVDGPLTDKLEEIFGTLLADDFGVDALVGVFDALLVFIVFDAPLVGVEKLDF